MEGENGAQNGSTSEQQVAPPVAERITEEERLTMENMYLRLQNMQLQLQALDRQKNDLVEQMRQSSVALNSFRLELTKKYGKMVDRSTVNPDGTFRQPQQQSQADLAATLMAHAPKT